MSGLKCVSFEDLYSMNVEINDIYAERQKWIKGVLYSNGTPRRINAIILLSGCNGVYTNLKKKNTSFFAPQHSIVCLPQGSDYSILNSDCGLADQDAYLIEFHITSNGVPITLGTEPFIISTPFPTVLSNAVKDVVRRYEEPIKSPISVMSSVCEVLSILGKENSCVLKNDYSAIAQGVKLIEKDPFSDISIEEIAKMCNISSGGFRRSFNKYLGKSPIQYRTDLRIKTIQYILENSDITIEKMSELLGISNTPYVYKMFKSKVGVSPGAYRSIIKSKQKEIINKFP